MMGGLTEDSNDISVNVDHAVLCYYNLSIGPYNEDHISIRLSEESVFYQVVSLKSEF